MPKIFPVIVKRGDTTIIVAGDETNFTAIQKVGLRLRALLETITRSAVGVGITRQVGDLVTTEKAGIAITTNNQGAADVAQTPGVLLAEENAATVTPPATPGAELVQVTYDLVHEAGGTATNQGANSWTNVGNASGRANGSNATAAGDALGARTYIAQLAYADFPNKSSLTITQVLLHFHAQQSGTSLNNGDLRFLWAKGGAYTQLALHTNNVNFLVTPETFDITASIASWADLNALTTRVEFRTDIGEALIQAALDAVEIEIVATHTEAL